MSEEGNKKYLENVEDLEKYYEEMYKDYGEKKDWKKKDREIEEGEREVK